MDNLESAPQPRPNIADPDNFDVPSQAFINFQYDSLIPYFQKLSVFFPGMVASSSSSISLTPGNKTIEIEPGKVFPAGSGVRVTNAANINEYFIASVVDYDAVTGDFEFSPSTIVGTGTFSNWQIISTTLNGNLQAAINEARATVAATATSTPLWTAANGNVQDWTGTPTITNFPAAPQAGASRKVKPAAGTIFTNNANISVQGSTNYTVSAGDEITITAFSTTVFDVTINKKSGRATVETVTELATEAEYITGTNNTKALTPQVARNKNIVLGTEVASTSGTAIDFTGIPSWAKRITLTFTNISTNGTGNYILQIGDSTSFLTTGYLGATMTVTAGGSGSLNNSSGFIFAWTVTSGSTVSGGLILTKIADNKWACLTNTGRSNEARADSGGGVATLTDPLTRIRVTTVGGVNTFDSGSINIAYE